MDAVYQLVQGLQLFIPIIAVAVVCMALFFFRGAPDEDEYLGQYLPTGEWDRHNKLSDELKRAKKKTS